jgi:hypothetical protein
MEEAKRNRSRVLSAIEAAPVDGAEGFIGFED